MNAIKRPRRNWLAAAITLVVTFSLCALTIVLSYVVPSPINISAIKKDDSKSIKKDDSKAQVSKRVDDLLAEADQESSAAIDKHMASVRAFLDERKSGSRAFAESLTGLRGKWEIMKAQVKGSGDEEYAKFLEGAFDEHLFRGEALQQVVASAIRAYLTELDGIEARLLVRLRADLKDANLADQIPVLRSEEAMTKHFRELSEKVANGLSNDLKIVATREILLWEGTTLVTDLTLKLAEAVGVRLGVSTTILSAGAASGWRTLGVGLVVAIVLDAIVNQIIKAAGYDAEERVAQRVNEMLDDLSRTITEGDPETRKTLTMLKEMKMPDAPLVLRITYPLMIEQLEAGSKGLRGILTQIGTARAQVRREALKEMQGSTAP